jgi:hypothetical protein
MSDYAAILAVALNEGAFGRLEEEYLHRARREHSLGEIVGRDHVVADDLALAAQTGPAEVVQFTRSTCSISLRGGFRQHRWCRREGGRIAHEWIVSDSPVLREERAARVLEVGLRFPVQPALGEVRSGRGQFSAGTSAWLCAEPQALLDSLHRIWNGRRLDEVDDLYGSDAAWSGPGESKGGPAEAKSWILRLLARLPDATLLFDTVEQEGQRVALLWRLFGHAGPVRVRLIGSSLIVLGHDGRISADDTLIDELALDASAFRPMMTMVR